MDSSKKMIIGIIAVIIVIGVIYGVASSSTDPEEPGAEMPESEGLSGEITIGSIRPLSGDWSAHGTKNYEGAKYGVAEFNKYLAEQGEEWTLKMLAEDSNTNPVVALEKLESLNAKNIDIVLGPETSSNIRNIEGYADSNGMLLVSCCSTAPSLAIPDDNIFRLVPDDSNQGVAISKLIRNAGIDVLFPVWRGDTWGDGLKEASTTSFMERGGQVDEGIRYNPERPEFSASASLLAQKVQENIDQYGADKVAVLFLGFSEVLQFTQSASEHESLDKVRWFGPGAITKEDALIDDRIGFKFATAVQFTTVQPGISSNPVYQKVQGYMMDKFGYVPDTYVHSSYDTVWIVGLAILAAQSSNADDVKAAIPGVAEKYSGAVGSTKLNAAGDLAQGNYEVWGIRDGDWRLLGQYTQSDDALEIYSQPYE